MQKTVDIALLKLTQGGIECQGVASGQINNIVDLIWDLQKTKSSSHPASLVRETEVKVNYYLCSYYLVFAVKLISWPAVESVVMRCPSLYHNYQGPKVNPAKDLWDIWPLRAAITNGLFGSFVILLTIGSLILYTY